MFYCEKIDYGDLYLLITYFLFKNVKYFPLEAFLRQTLRFIQKYCNLLKKILCNLSSI